MIADLGTLLARIRSHEAPIRALGIEHLDIFGSWARGAAHAGSDVDLVAEFNGTHRASYFDLARLKILLENDLLVRIDILSSGGIRAHGKNVGEVVRVF